MPKVIVKEEILANFYSSPFGIASRANITITNRTIIIVSQIGNQPRNVNKEIKEIPITETAIRELFTKLTPTRTATRTKTEINIPPTSGETLNRFPKACGISVIFIMFCYSP